MSKSRKFLCFLPLSFGAYFIALINLIIIVVGCAAAVYFIEDLTKNLLSISILILFGIVALFWTLMNIFFIISIRRKDPHGVVDYLNIMLMITVFEFVIIIAGICHVSYLLWRQKPIVYSWTFIITVPILFLIQTYFTYIVEVFYRMCEDLKQEILERIASEPTDTHAYENHATLRHTVMSNGRILLETDV